MKKAYADKSLDLNTGPFPKPAQLTIETDCSRYYGAPGSPQDTIPNSEKLNQVRLEDLRGEDI
jgi:penicillin-binding protein 1A